MGEPLKGGEGGGIKGEKEEFPLDATSLSPDPHHNSTGPFSIHSPPTCLYS